MAQLAFSSYVVGVLVFDRLRKDQITIEFPQENLINEELLKFLRIVLIIITIIFSVAVINSGLSLAGSDIVEIINYQLVTIYVIMFAIYLLVNNIFHSANVRGSVKEFIHVNRIALISALIIILLSFWYGDRGPVLQVTFIVLLILTTRVKSLPLKYFIPILVLGFVIMTFISSTRTNVNNLRTSSVTSVVSEGVEKFSTFETFWDYAMDLIINSRSAYVSLEIVKEQGYFYGKSYFPVLFSPIPGLPTVLTEFVFGKNPADLSTAQIITNREGVVYGGLGTNAVGDMYMNFGLIGVIVSFFLFGLSIRWIELNKSIYVQLSFLLTIALAIYFPRASLLEHFSTVIRGVIILYVMFSIFKARI